MCAIINIILNAVLIQRAGAVAACYTTVVSYFLLFILTGIVSGKCMKHIYSKKVFFMFYFMDKWSFSFVIYSL